MFFLLHLLYSLLQVIQPVAVPLCFVLGWTFVALLLWNVGAAVRDGIIEAKKMHQIPCANCQFFTRDYHLKCTVHPAKALSHEAIDCTDYELVPSPFTSVQR